MRSGEIPQIKPQEGEHIILGVYPIVIEGKEGIRDIKTLIVQSPEGSQYPFLAIDPTTEKEVELTPTRIVEVYRQILNREPPNYLTQGKTDTYWHIRRRKKREKIRKNTPIETPTTND